VKRLAPKTTIFGLVRVMICLACSVSMFMSFFEKGKATVLSLRWPARPSFHIPGYPPSSGLVHMRVSPGSVRLARAMRSAMCPERGRRSAVSALKTCFASFSPYCSILSV